MSGNIWAQSWAIWLIFLILYVRRVRQSNLSIRAWSKRWRLASRMETEMFDWLYCASFVERYCHAPGCCCCVLSMPEWCLAVTVVYSAADEAFIGVGPKQLLLRRTCEQPQLCRDRRSGVQILWISVRCKSASSVGQRSSDWSVQSLWCGTAVAGLRVQWPLTM